MLGRPEQWAPSEQGPKGRGVSSVLSPSSQQLPRGRVPLRSVPAEGFPEQTLGALGPTAEARGTAVTPVRTTRALDGGSGGVRVARGRTRPRPTPGPRAGGGTDLAVGTAGPAPSAVSAAGLVIVAEVPLPTVHVPHTHVPAAVQVGSRAGRVHLLLAGSGLHVAGVPSRAAVLAVLTAHGLGDKGALHSRPPNVPPPGTGLPCPVRKQAGGHSRVATGSRPRPRSGSGSTSAPPGSWCAGHSPCLWSGTGKPGGQATWPVRSPPCSLSYSAPQPNTCSPGGSRQPGEVAEKGGLGSHYGTER